MSSRSTIPNIPVDHRQADSSTQVREVVATHRSHPLIRVLRHEQFGIVLVLIVLVAVIGLTHPLFLKPGSLFDLLRSASAVAIVGFGMVFLIAMRELDLSVGAIYGLSTLVSAELMAAGMPPWLGLITGPGLGVLLGAANAFFANTFRLPVIIVTLGTVTLISGISIVVSNSQAVTGLPLKDPFFKILGNSFFGVPVIVVVMAVVGVLLIIVFKRTPFGARVRAIGSNEAAARFSGIRVSRTRLQVLMLVGGLCGLAGILSLAYYQGADPTLGSGLSLQVIAAAIIGGTAISGGTGSVPGALVGALLIATISSGLVYFGVGPNWSGIVTGGTVLVAVCADGALRTRRARRLALAGS